MSKLSKICLICLRTDRKLKVVDSKLSDFHDELCDYAITVIEACYCYECEFLLKKLYNFKAKCILATKIIKMERRKKIERTPVALLYTLMPTISLGVWTQTNTKIYTFTFDKDPISNENTSSPICIDVTAPMSNSNTTTPKSNTTALNSNTMEPNKNTEAPNSNREVPNSCMNTKAPISNVDTSEPPILLPDISKQSLNIPDPHIVLVRMDTILNDMQECHGNQVNEDHTIVNEEDIKKENESKDTVKVFNNVPLKLEEAHFENTVLENHRNNSDKTEWNNGFDEFNDLSDFNANSDYEEKVDNISDDSCMDSDYEKDTKVTTNKKNNGLTEHCNSMLKGTQRKKLIKDTSDDGKNKSINGRNINDKRKTKRSTKLKITDRDTKKGRVKKIKEKDSHIRERFHTKRGILAELANLADSDDEVLGKVKMKKSRYPFTKERLIAELTEKFASCGELVTDGVTIDKEFIIECLKDKVTEFVMRQLWNAVQAKYSIKPQALRLFKSIQNKYQNEYDSVFDIDYLNTKQKMMDEFEMRKTYRCYVDAEFKCEICYTGFKHEKKLVYHKKCHDESVGDFVCPICNVRQRLKKSLISHLNSHEAVYKCKLCPLVTYYKGSMVNHYQQHKGVKYKCEQCDTVFGSRSAYVTHVSYRHARRHICTACGRAFSSAIGLKWHTTRLHQDEPPASTDGDKTVRCYECDLEFPSEEVYLRHVRITHDSHETRGRKPGTTLASTLTSDPRITRPRKKPVLTCRVCNTVGSSNGWLNMHFASEHPDCDLSLVYADKKPHLCHVCGKGFSTIYILKSHLNTHTGARPFSCPSCPARFARSLSLRLHRALHYPPSKPCPHCGKKFRSYSNLANHVRFHVGDRRYKCKICAKGFLHRGTLNEHVRGVHHNVRRVRKKGGCEPTRGDQTTD